jgi:perosamine synthetase
VARVMRSGSLLKSGAEVRLLEAEWADFIGSRFALAVDSCSHAIHIALLSLQLRPGSRVGVPSLGFVGTVHPIVQAGYEPVFIDVDARTFNIDHNLLENAEIDALVIVHLHGLPCDMDAVMDFARKKGVPVIEDACQAHGATWRGKKVGSLGDIGCFSLNEVKNLPAGQGGLITTSDERLHSRLRSLCGYGTTARGHYVDIGMSYGLSELPACIARVQLELLEERILRSQRNAQLMSDCFERLKGLLPPFVPLEAKHVWHKYRIWYAGSPDSIVRLLNSRGIPAEFWARYALPDHPAYHPNGRGTFYENGNTRKVVAGTFFLWTEKYPLIAQDSDTVSWVCEQIEEIVLLNSEEIDATPTHP